MRGWRRRRNSIRLEHPQGCSVDVHLPADMETVGWALDALGKVGFEIPDAEQVALVLRAVEGS